MAKEWEKFQAEHKKLQDGIKKYALSEAEKLKKRIGISLGTAWEGEDYFRESMAKARENGVNSEKLADFQKDKDFKDGLSTWKKAAEIHQGEVDALVSFCKSAKAHHTKLEKLHSDIIKDLKKRSSSSASKKEIEKLQSTIAKEVEDLKKAFQHEGKLNAMEKLYAANFKKNLDRILKEKAETQARKKDATELPQLLVDRNIKRSATKIAALSKSISNHCDSAMKSAGGDAKDVKPELQAAAAKLAELKKIVESYHGVQKKFPQAIEDSKDKKKILDTIKKFDNLHSMSERKIRGTATTIKKATR